MRAGSTERRESGVCRKTILLVDASIFPKTNKRDSKLGVGNCTFASAAAGYDPTTKQMSGGDGTTSILTRFPFEPDDWILRKHGSSDQVWASRLIVDKTNKASDIKNRSTHVINQDENQLYGNFADMFWICKTGVDTDFSVSGAGLASGGGGKRDALGLSCAKNEGFISDGKSFGQLAHILCFIPPDTTPTPDGTPGGTPTTGGGGTSVPTGGINSNGFTQPNTPTGEVDFPTPPDPPPDRFVLPGGPVQTSGNITVGPVNPFDPR